MTTKTAIDKIMYFKNDVQVRLTKKDDLLHVATNMRIPDINEIWASHHITPLPALTQSYACSAISLTILKDGIPVAIFGVTPYKNGHGLIWLLGTNRMDEIKWDFIRYSRYFVKYLLKDYKTLFNFVDSRNRKSVKWLRFIGARVDDPIPYGLDNILFHPFVFERKK